jgi:hypothetical protein
LSVGLIFGRTKPALKLAEEVFPVKVFYLETARYAYKHFYLPFKESYEEAGAPYGATDEGLWRWMEEQFEETSH